MIADHPTPKSTTGGVGYTLNSRDYKGVMIVALSEAKENNQDRNRPSDGLSNGVG